jgi:hypothetical protein
MALFHCDFVCFCHFPGYWPLWHLYTIGCTIMVPSLEHRPGIGRAALNVAGPGAATVTGSSSSSVHTGSRQFNLQNYTQAGSGAGRGAAAVSRCCRRLRRRRYTAACRTECQYHRGRLRLPSADSDDRCLWH